VRTRKSAASFATDIGRTGITLLVGLVATPFLLNWLGEARFGAHRTAMDWLGYLALLELGIGGALLPMLARAFGSKDAGEARATLVAGTRALVRVTLVALALGGALAFFITRLIPVGDTLAGDLRWGFVLGLAGLLFLPFSPLRILQEARQRSYVVNTLLLLQGLLITGLALLFAWKGWGITGQFAAALIGGIPFFMVLAWMAKRAYPGVLRSLFTAPTDAQPSRRLRRLSPPAFILNICGRVSVMTDNMVVAFFLGPAIVVPFFVTQRLAVLLQGQLQSLGNASWAGLAELYVQKQHAVFNERVIDLTRIIAVVGMAGLIPIAVYNDQFVRLWLGLDRYGGDAVTFLAATNAYLLAVFSLWGWCFNGTGHIRELVAPSVAAMVLNLGASIALVKPLGMVGPLLGTTIGFAAVSVWYLPALMQRVFGTSAGRLVKTVALPLVLGLPYGAGLHWVAGAQGQLGWMTLAVSMLLAAALFGLLCWFLILKGSERRLHMEQIRAVFRR
jgi:O-antigen/teichoic acid export membrane protein